MKRGAATITVIAAALGAACSSLAGEAKIVAELQQQIVRCWSVPADVDQSTTPVTLTFKLDPRGELIGTPLIVQNPEEIGRAHV